MTNKLKEITELEYQIHAQSVIERKKMFGEEFLYLESKFDIVYPDNLKQIASEIGFSNTLPIMMDFYDCLNDEIHYKTTLTTNFIKTLLHKEISVKEIQNLEFNLTDKTFHHKKVDELYAIVNQKFECMEVAVNIFDDSYNCYIVLVLTGKNKGYICDENWQEITHLANQYHFPYFTKIARLENYIIEERKKYLNK